MRSSGLLLAAATLLAGLGAVLVVSLTGDGEAKQDLTGTLSMTAPTAQAPQPGGAVQARRLRLQRMGRFDNPLYVTAPPGDRRRVFVVEQGGRIQVLRERSAARGSPFLDISGLLTSGGEQGLLSMAFAPDYARSGRFYVDYTDRRGDTRVEEFRRSRRSPNRADRSSRRPVLFVDQPFDNHNGGLLLFGPDGLLYIGMGDGGGGGRPLQQRPEPEQRCSGKILRIDPRQSGSQPLHESRASNPFVGPGPGATRSTRTGCATPGASRSTAPTATSTSATSARTQFEEIDYARRRGRRAGETTAGAASRARRRYDASRSCPGAVAPVLRVRPRRRRRARSPAGSSCATRALPALAGRYLYGDFCRGQVRSFRIAGGRATGDRSLGLTRAVS